MTQQNSFGADAQPPTDEPLLDPALHFAAPGFAEEPLPPAFAAMPETMPPPPVRPVLPPDFGAEPKKTGLIARLLGGLAK